MRHGYCFRLDKYLTAEEVGMMAIAHVYGHYIVGFERRREENYWNSLHLNDSEGLIAYKSVEDFKRRGVLNCCNPKAYDSWESRRKEPNTGRYHYYKTISFRYKIDTLSKMDEAQNYAAASVFMDGCGGQVKSSLRWK